MTFRPAGATRVRPNGPREQRAHASQREGTPRAGGRRWGAVGSWWTGLCLPLLLCWPESDALYTKCHLSPGRDSVYWGGCCPCDPRSPALNSLANPGVLRMALKGPREEQRALRPLRRRPRQWVWASDGFACHRYGRGRILDLGGRGRPETERTAGDAFASIFFPSWATGSDASATGKSATPLSVANTGFGVCVTYGAAGQAQPSPGSGVCLGLGRQTGGWGRTCMCPWNPPE